MCVYPETDVKMKKSDPFKNLHFNDFISLTLGLLRTVYNGVTKGFVDRFSCAGDRQYIHKPYVLYTPDRTKTKLD